MNDLEMPIAGTVVKVDGNTLTMLTEEGKLFKLEWKNRQWYRTELEK
jgi:hypothetical protein